MEKVFKVKDSTNNLIIEFSRALKKAHILDGCDLYYEDENYHCPFFKIPKPFLKEHKNDPDVHYIFVDIEEKEYTVHGNYAHEHVTDINNAIFWVSALLKGFVVEYALVINGRQASCFIKNTGDPKKNVDYIANDKKSCLYIMDIMNKKMPPQGSHLHIYFEKSFPGYLMLKTIPMNEILNKYSIYMISAQFGQHPEYYLIQER